MINNPDVEIDTELYVFTNLKYVGIELWQVKSGSLFDNILVTDDPEYAKSFAEETWGKNKEVRLSMFIQIMHMFIQSMVGCLVSLHSCYLYIFFYVCIIILILAL